MLNTFNLELICNNKQYDNCLRKNDEDYVNMQRQLLSIDLYISY